MPSLYKMSVDEFESTLKDHIVSVQAAGAGFAAAIALAPEFRGQEIGVKQALNAAGIELELGSPPLGKRELTDEQAEQALALCAEVRTTLADQYRGWQKRSVFERQWMLRDFKRHRTHWS